MACDEKLGYMFWRLDVVVFCTVTIPSDGIFSAVSRTDMSHDFINFVLACAIFNLRLLGCDLTRSIFAHF